MQLRWGPIPPSPDFTPQEPWRPLKEPTFWVAQLAALPVAVAAGGVFALLWFALTALIDIKPLDSPFGFLAWCVFILIFHELVHALATPLAGMSPRTFVGFWPSRMVGYCHYDGELSRNRFLGILLLPLVVLSILPLLVCVATGVVSVWIALVSVLNAMSSAVDVLGAAILLRQVPAGAIVRNQVWRTYWRMAAPAQAIHSGQSR